MQWTNVAHFEIDGIGPASPDIEPDVERQSRSERSMTSMRIEPAVRWRAGSGNAVRSLVECRAEALRSLFPKLAPWRESAAARCERARIEALLYMAENFDELQRRIREVLRTVPPHDYQRAIAEPDARRSRRLDLQTMPNLDARPAA